MRDAAVMRACPAVISAEAVCAVAALRSRSDRCLTRNRLAWRVHRLTGVIDVMLVCRQISFGWLRLRCRRGVLIVRERREGRASQRSRQEQTKKSAHIFPEAKIRPSQLTLTILDCTGRLDR